MTADRFTVLLPITRPPVYLPYAVESVLAQSHDNFELFILSDGAPPATLAWARDVEKRDRRIRLFDFPKGERNGEAHRHAALEEATGTLVAHIADDDLWLPDFLAEMALHLRTFDFGNLVQSYVDAEGNVFPIPGDLATQATRHRMMNNRWNPCGLTVTGYRLSAYRQLAEPWVPAPENVPSDLYMWRKFLSDGRFAAGSRVAIESVVFPAPLRVEWSEERRAAEIAAFADRLRDADRRRDFMAEGYRRLYAGVAVEATAEATARIASI